MTLSGTGFTTNSTVALNGQAIASNYVNSTQLTLTIPASSVAIPGNLSFTVTTPAPGGGTSSPLAYTTYIQMPNNDIVYNPTDGLLYVSVPTSAGAVWPAIRWWAWTRQPGNVMRQIWVGSNPNKLALSTDGTQLFVGLDGAGAVAQVDLTQGKVVNQFSLGGGDREFTTRRTTALYLAAVPGSPNSVAVALAGSFNGGAGVTIFDSGVARAKQLIGHWLRAAQLRIVRLHSLHGAVSSIEQLTVDSTGISATTTLAPVAPALITSIQYDSGQALSFHGRSAQCLYGRTARHLLQHCDVLPANGPVVSDSALGKGFHRRKRLSVPAGQVLAFDESNFNLIGSIPVNGIGTPGLSD